METICTPLSSSSARRINLNSHRGSPPTYRIRRWAPLPSTRDTKSTSLNPSPPCRTLLRSGHDLRSLVLLLRAPDKLELPPRLPLHVQNSPLVPAHIHQPRHRVVRRVLLPRQRLQLET